MKIVLMVVMIALAYGLIYSGVTDTSFFDMFSFGGSGKSKPKPITKKQ